MRAVLAVVLCLSTQSCTWLAARARDAGDCVRVAVGVGPGLTLEVHATDWIAPGLGAISRTTNVGWLDRRVQGVWEESVVIKTPRLAFETLLPEIDEEVSTDHDPSFTLLRLAASSMNLPNERWIRRQGVTSVDYFALVNPGDTGASSRAHWLADLLVEEGQPVFHAERSAWQRGMCEVGVTALLIHARAGFNPLEFVDFLGGFVGFDFADDDRRAPFYEFVPDLEYVRRRERIEEWLRGGNPRVTRPPSVPDLEPPRNPDR